ncbi:uncharacterized protein LOC115667685 [Syzygium oleosum]|uniref:uncharacterized protein LOC115667685 n=1 Tax=Syzygium oleosum TaxID=219896 RepID=UPI0024BB5C20|nr:uncharacterized protein LOC115667685 [Syzygium oleosum]
MGGADIRILDAPKDELRAWWNLLSPTNRKLVEGHIGRLLPLLEVKVRTGLVRALAHFWCPETSTFIFGKHELTPTLEEYSVLIGKPLESELVTPPLGIDSTLMLAEFLNVGKDELGKVLKANRGTCPFSFLSQCFEKATSFQKGKIFLLAFFGFMIFPHCKNACSPSIAWLVQQVCLEKNFGNTILVETFISLIKFKQHVDKTFHAPLELLQIWFLSHIKGCGDLLTISELSDSSHPILSYKEKQGNTPDYHYSEWIIFMKNARPQGFYWHANWFKVEEARLTCNGVGPVPLLGFTGAIEYYPARVSRQYQILQGLPPALQPELLRVDFADDDKNHEGTVAQLNKM